MSKKWLTNAFDNPRSKSFWLVNDFLAVVIILSVVLVMLETNNELLESYRGAFSLAEYVITAIFTLEYIVYIYLAKSKRKYLFSFYGIIDLLAILPPYLLLANFQFLKIFRVVRLLRLFRTLRLLKLIRLAQIRYKKQKIARQTLKTNLAIYLVAFLILTIVFSVILFEIERNVPGSEIQSLPDAMWSVIAALSSVGLGNVFPASFAGRLFLGLVMLTGVGFLSFAVLTMGKFFQQVLFGEDIEDDLKEIESHSIEDFEDRLKKIA